MSHKRFVKNIGILGVTQVFMALSGIINLLVITKLLGAENYGIWTELTVTLGMIAPIALLGLPYTLVRFLAAEKDQQKIQDSVWSASAVILGFTLVIALLLALFSGPISRFFHCDQILVQILACILVFEYLNTLLFNIFRIFQQIDKYCIFLLIQTIGGNVLMILAILMGYGLLGVVWSSLFIRIADFVIMLFIVVKQIGIHLPRFKSIKEHMTFGLPTIFGDISFWITQSSDNYLVAFFLGTLFVGYYAPAYTIAGCIAFFITPLGFILPAVLSQHYEADNLPEVKRYIKYSIKYFLMVTIPAVFGLSMLSKQLLTIFSTADIAQHSYFIIPLVSSSILLLGLCAVVEQIFALKKKTHLMGSIYLASAVINIILNIVFIPKFGLMGAAAATLAAYGTTFAFTWYYAFKEIPFPVDIPFIFKSVVASGVMSAALFFFHASGLVQTLVAIALGIAIYGGLLLLFKSFGQEEKRLLQKIWSGT